MSEAGLRLYMVDGSKDNYILADARPGRAENDLASAEQGLKLVLANTAWQTDLPTVARALAERGQ